MSSSCCGDSPVQPGAGEGPVAFGGAQRDAHCRGRVGHGQAGEVAEFDERRGGGIGGLQML